MKYQSELINEILGERGHEKSTLHYESECIEQWIDENEGAYPKLCEYQSEWLNYIVEKPVGNFPYETINNVTEATVYNVVPFAYKSAILKGNSEVVAGKNKCNMEEIKTGWIDGTTGVVSSDEGVYIPVEVSGTITISNYINTDSRYVYEYDVDGNYLGRTQVTTDNVTLVLKQNTTLIKIGFYRGTLSTVKSLELQVEQGEIATEYEPYNPTLVTIKMPVLTTTGSNLFNPSEAIRVDNTAFDNNGDLGKINGYFTTTEFVPVKPNTTYIGRYQNHVAVYDENKNFITKFALWGNEIKEFTTPKNGHYIRFQIAKANVPNQDYSQICVVEGSSYVYIPYQSNILTVNEDIELRGIGDVKDTLDCLTGQVTERIGEVVLDGSEDWSLNKTTINHTLWATTITNPANNSSVRKNNMLCNKLMVEDFASLHDKEYEFITINNGKSNEIYLKLDKTKSSSEAVLKNYLQSNPLTIQYRLATESIKTVDLSVTNQDGETLSKLTPLEGTMNIATDGTPLKPTVSMEIPVEATTQNLMSFINIEEEEK